MMLFLGGSAILTAPKDIFPNINIPVVTVIWQYTGLTPEEMEQRVTTYSEYSISSNVSDIRNIESQTLSGVAVVPIDANGNGKVDPGERVFTRALLQAGIKSGDYPHPPARLLYVMTLGAPKGAMRDFILWILTDGQKLLDKAGFMPIPDKLLQEQVIKLKGKSVKKK